MPDNASHLDDVGSVVEALSELGLCPVLVGGMALVVTGSRRVTRDFNFVVAQPGERLPELLDLFAVAVWSLSPGSIPQET